MDYHNKQPLYDETHVRFQVFMETRLNLEIVNTVPLNFHKCDQGDFDSFYPINSNFKNFKQELQTS